MPQLRFKSNTAWCNKCGRITGRDKNNNCLVCLHIQEQEYKAMQEPQASTACSHCGSKEDVVMRWRYMGGHGYQWIAECRSWPLCWERQDAAMGIESKPIVKVGT